MKVFSVGVKKRRLEVLFAELLRKDPDSFFLFLVHGVLLFLSWGFRSGVRCRGWMYDHGMLAVKKVPIPVVSIGNIVAGGTGKTPVTMTIAETLATHCRVAILSRGYRSRAEHGKDSLVLCRGNGPLFGPDECGDEAYLMALRIPQAIVVVGKNRYQSAMKALQEGAELVILDDGFQHRRLMRQMDIIVLNGKDPWGGNHFLPRGFLREEPSRLKKADLIIVNGGQEQLKERAPTVHVDNVPIGVFNQKGEKVVLLTQNAALFCGIASPKRFEETVASLGISVVAAYFFADHDAIATEALIDFAKKAKKKGAEFLVCTEKDWVKLKSRSEVEQRLGLPIRWIKCELKIRNNFSQWEECIERIKQMVKR